MDNIKVLTQKKAFIVVLLLILISLVIMTGTYAWFTWRSTSNPSVTIRIGNMADVIFQSGSDINSIGLTPSFNYTDGEITTFSINNNNTEKIITYSVSLDVEQISDELKTESFKYVLVKTSNGVDEVVTSGDFANSSVDNDMIIYDDQLLMENSSIDYKFYIYIDANYDNTNLIGKTFIGSLNVEAAESDLVPRLPSGYQEVEYIESTGTQFINTGVNTLNGNCSLKVVLQSTAQTQPNSSAMFISFGLYSGHYITQNGSNWNVATSPRLPATNKSTFDINIDTSIKKVTGTLNDLQFSQTYTNTSLGTINLLGRSSYRAYGKLFYCQITQNNVLVRDLVPCYRKADNVVGMYDLVSNTFLVNAGTGTFIKGDDVTTLV